MNVLGRIAQEGLLWGQPEIQHLVSLDVRETLLQSELLDWLSALYWAEGLAAQYANKMRAVPDDREKNAWERVYRDEIEYQALIAGCSISECISYLTIE